MKNIKYKMQITTCSPVFIGSGEEIAPFEYIFPENYFLKVVPKDIFRYLNDAERKQYERIIRSLKSGDLQKIEQNNLKSLLLSKSNIPYKEFSSQEKIHTRPIQKFIENIHGFYIPGSSIKGAFRTLVTKNFLREINTKILTKETLNTYQAEIDNLVKRISVSDSQNIDDNCFELIQPLSINLEKPERNNNQSPYNACLALSPNAKAEFFLTINEDEKFNIDKLLKQCTEEINRAVNIFCLKDESFSHATNQNELEPNFSLGAYNGFEKHTIWDIQFDFEKEMYPQKARTNLMKELPRLRKNPRTGMPAYRDNDKFLPRCIQVVKEENCYLPFGNCHLQILNKEEI